MGPYKQIRCKLSSAVAVGLLVLLILFMLTLTFHSTGVSGAISHVYYFFQQVRLNLVKGSHLFIKITDKREQY